MSRLNLEITLYHTSYIENLVSELQSIVKKKKNLYINVKSESDFQKKLSFEERQFIKYLTLEEDKILLQLTEQKGWNVEVIGTPQTGRLPGKLDLN